MSFNQIEVRRPLALVASRKKYFTIRGRANPQEVSMSTLFRNWSCFFSSFVRKITRVHFAAFVFVIGIGALSLTMFRSGAQELKDPSLKTRQKTFNLDIRANGGGELLKTVEKHSAGRDNFVADIGAMAREQAFIMNRALTRIKKQIPTAEVTVSELTGSVEVLRSAKTLTGPSFGRDGKDIAFDFINANKDLYGLDDDDVANLHYVGESVNELSGLRLVIFEQVVNGRQVFQGECKVSIDREGSVVQSLSNLAPHATRKASPIGNLISPEGALVKTMATVDVALDPATMKADRSSDNLDAEITVKDPRIGGKVTSKIVYFPVAPGLLIPAWSQTIFGERFDWYALVDATDGTVLWRKNIRSDVSTHQARFRVYVQADGSTPSDSPSPLSPSTLVAGFQPPGIAPSIVNMLTVQNITASPNGWIDDCPLGICTANETQTLGNNTLVCVDRTDGAGNVCDTVAPSDLDGNGRPMGNLDASLRNRDFLGLLLRDFESTFLPAPQGGNPEAGQTSSAGGAAGTTFLRASAVQQFYVTNWYHDRLYALGFTPAARNFQNLNFGGGGAENDRVLVDVQDGQSVDNANFSTPSDGISGRSQMFNFTGPTIDRDGGLDSEILIHELTHGLSNRLVGNAAGLVWDVGAGMGEGWSDFYAMSLLNNTAADNPNSGYASGAYATYKAFGFTTYVDNYTYGIRRFPYHTTNTTNPLTWADVDDVTNNLSGGMAPSPLTFNDGGAMEVHNSGEVWAMTLWEVRSRIIADPAGANGNVPTGNNTTLSIVTDALRLFTPNNPSFVQGRDALVDADCAANAACPNEVSIWGGFADRGLGYGAIAPLGRIFGFAAGHMGVGESFASPNLDINTVTINDTGGNNSGGIDANEPVRLVINIRNPWRGAARGVANATATLTTSTPGAIVLQNSTTYPAIAATGNANPNGPFLVVRAPAAAACGSSIDLTLTINSSLGSVARSFKLRLGVPSGTGAPVTYTRDPAPDIVIPDGPTPRGVGDSLTITDDLEIADLNFRMDNLTHTWHGDVTVMLRGPNGYGTDLIAAIGGASDGGSGDNLINTLIDDEAVAPNDLLSVTAASAPMTGDWLPIFNAPSWTTLVGFPTDPVGQLSRFDGQSTAGVWNLRVSDQFANDTGSLNQWSLIVTPRAFACTPFVPTAANISISGRVLDPNLQGVSKARVTVTGQNGEARTVMTNGFGYFRISELIAGQSYLVEINSKRFTFSPRVVNGIEDVTDLDFIPLP